MKEGVSMKESVKEGWRVIAKMTYQQWALITLDLCSMLTVSNIWIIKIQTQTLTDW